MLNQSIRAKLPVPFVQDLRQRARATSQNMDELRPRAEGEKVSSRKSVAGGFSTCWLGFHEHTPDSTKQSSVVQPKQVQMQGLNKCVHLDTNNWSKGNTYKLQIFTDSLGNNPPRDLVLGMLRREHTCVE